MRTEIQAPSVNPTVLAIGKTLGKGALSGFAGALGGEAAKALMGALGLAPADPNTALLEEIGQQLHEVNQNLREINSDLRQIEQTLIHNQNFNDWITIYRDGPQSFYRAKEQIDYLYDGLLPRTNGVLDLDHGTPTWNDLPPATWAKKVIEGDGNDDPIAKLLLAIRSDVDNAVEGQNLIDTYVQVLIDSYCSPGQPATSTPWQATYALLLYLSEILAAYWRGTALLKAAVLLYVTPQAQQGDIEAHVASYAGYLSDMDGRSQAALFRVLEAMFNNLSFAVGADVGVVAREFFPAWEETAAQPCPAEVETRLAQTRQYAWGQSVATLEAMLYAYQPSRTLIPAGGPPEYKLVLYSIILGVSGPNPTQYYPTSYQHLKARAHLETLLLTGGQEAQFADFRFSLPWMEVVAQGTTGCHWNVMRNGGWGAYADRYVFWLTEPGTYRLDAENPCRAEIRECDGTVITFLGSSTLRWTQVGARLDAQAPFVYDLFAAYSQSWEENTLNPLANWVVVDCPAWWRRLLTRLTSWLRA